MPVVYFVDRAVRKRTEPQDPVIRLAAKYAHFVGQRRYNEQEVGQIFSKAASLQSASAGGEAADGTNLEELQRIAAEAGIDPKMIARAASELDSSRRVKPSPSPDTFTVSQGGLPEISDEAWTRLVTSVRTFSGVPGTVERTDSSLEWVGGSETQSIVLTASRASGDSRLTLLVDSRGGTAVAVVIGFVTTFLLALAPLVVAKASKGAMSPLVTILVTMLVVAACIVATNAVIRASRRNFGAQVQDLMDELVAISEASVPDVAQNELSSRFTGEASSLATPDSIRVQS